MRSESAVSLSELAVLCEGITSDPQAALASAPAARSCGLDFSQWNVEDTMKKVFDQTAFTFDEDKVVIEAQYENMKRFNGKKMIDIHVDVGANRARRIIESLKQA